MSPAETIYDATEGDFQEKVLDSSRTRPVLVDFWAGWCAPCRVLNPVLVRVAEYYRGGILLAKVEVDDNMHLAGQYHLTGFPSVLLFINGVEVDRFAGARNERDVIRFVEENIQTARKRNDPLHGSCG